MKEQSEKQTEVSNYLKRYHNENYKPDPETLDKFDKVTELYISTEKPLYKLFKEVGISPMAFYMVKNLIGNEANKLACAREAKQECRVEEIKEISEDTTLSVDERRMRIDAIVKQMQLENPKKYRDRQETTVNIQANAQVVRFEIPTDNR
jgi:hypothetical protein